MKTYKHKTAFTLVEVLLALAILGMLMTAVAFAFDASVKNYQANSGIYRTLNIGRQTLLRLTNDIRTAGRLNPDLNSVAVEDDGSNLDLTIIHTENNTEQTMTYRFNRLDKTFCLNIGGTPYELIGNDPQSILSDITFTPGYNSDGKVRNVRISMTLTDPESNAAQKLVAAAVVRRNIEY